MHLNKMIILGVVFSIISTSCSKIHIQSEKWHLRKLIVPCGMEFDCMSHPHHSYLEMYKDFSEMDPNLLNRILKSKKIELNDVIPDTEGSKKSSEMLALSCFIFLAFFDENSNLKYLIGLCDYNYVLTFIQTDDCQILNDRIIPTQGEDFIIDHIRKNKKLYTEIVQQYEKKGCLLLGEKSYINFCYPEIHPLP